MFTFSQQTNKLLSFKLDFVLVTVIIDSIRKEMWTMEVKYREEPRNKTSRGHITTVL